MALWNFRKDNSKKPHVLGSADYVRDFLNRLIAEASDVIGGEQIQNALSRKIPESEVMFDQTGQIISGVLPPSHSTTKRIFEILLKRLEDNFGHDFTDEMLSKIFSDFRKRYPDERNLAKITTFIPEGYLEEKKMYFLSKEKIEKAYEDLKTLDRAKSEFISVAAHQLRMPLSEIKWTLSLMMSGELGPITPTQKDYLTRTYESNDRMIHLVNDLLDTNTIQSGKLRYDFVPTDVVPVIESLSKEFDSMIARKKIQFLFTKKTTLPLLSLDQEKIRSTFQNLLDNAIKYTPVSGRIEISAEQTRPDKVVITISDTGIGIPKDEQRYIFQRLFRAKNAVKVETNGSGLGLFITKTIIEAHGGTIRFETKENQGTTFIIELPVPKKA